MSITITRITITITGMLLVSSALSRVLATLRRLQMSMEPKRPSLNPAEDLTLRPQRIRHWMNPPLLIQVLLPSSTIRMAKSKALVSVQEPRLTALIRTKLLCPSLKNLLESLNRTRLYQAQVHLSSFSLRRRLVNLPNFRQILPVSEA